MKITSNNIGDILCLYSSAECIRITGIKGHHLYYEREYGSDYMTPAQTADAFRVTDPSRLKTFEQNCALGKVLLNAELSAMRDLLAGDSSPEEIHDAGNSLDSTRQHQKHLFDRIDQERISWHPGYDIAKDYLKDRLSDHGADVFWGRKVERIRTPDGGSLFRIEGRTLGLDEAAAYLGGISYQEPEKRSSLDQKIRSAGSRRQRNPFVQESAHEYQTDR